MDRRIIKKKILSLFIESSKPRIKVDDSSFEGKLDPTQYDYETNTILVKSSYDVKADPEGWMVHELIHHKLKDVKDDGKEYPTNNIEKEAYVAQFKALGERGHTLDNIMDVNKFPTLAPKFTKHNGEYAPTLTAYWEMANGKINLNKESLSNNNADNKQPADPYGRGPCPHCKEFAVGTYRHRGAPVFCKNNHKWGGSCGHLDEDCVNTPLKELEGGLADGKTLKDIAKKHKVPLGDIKSQIEKGIDVEHEHTDDPKVAKDIAKDHGWETPTYYDELEAAGIDEGVLNEMPYFFAGEGNNGLTKDFDVQIEKFGTEEQFKDFLISVFKGDVQGEHDIKQPVMQVSNPDLLSQAMISVTFPFPTEEEIRKDPNLARSQDFLLWFTRRYRVPKATLKTITKQDVDYFKKFVINAKNIASELQP